jgi:UDP:flavonoid glycosyltransferase YjiC (YdhE family)
MVDGSTRRRETHPLRMLFGFAGGTGHLAPLAPVARAAAARGHAVAVAAQAGMVATVEAAGFHAFDTGGATLRGLAERTPLLPLDPAREARVIGDTFAGRIARERADRLVALCRDWRPDVLVCDETDFGAMVAAERLAVPRATVLCIATGRFIPAALVAAPLNDLRRAHGLAPDPELQMVRRNVILSPFPPSLRDPEDAAPGTVQRFRPAVAEPGARPPAAPLRVRPRAPLVYFTLGTVFNVESGDLFERVLAGLRELPVEVVVTVGRDLDPRALGPQPPHVRVGRFIPQRSLLPHCSLVICHAGSGSVLGALAHAVPMVLLPLGADQPANAARCQELGVARVLDAERVTADDLRAGAAAVLDAASYRERAGRIAREIAGLPPVADAVSRLERLARGRPRPL